MQFTTIEEALESIGFEAVAKEMEILNWRILVNNDICFPTVNELKDSLLQLYKKATLAQDPNDATHSHGWAKSGAWGVSKSKYTDSERVGVPFTVSKDILLTTDK